jgi:signal transduction histidine kinase
VPMAREPFLVVAALVIFAAAQLSKPGVPLEIAGAAVAVLAMVAKGAGVRLPAEAFAALVILPVTVVVSQRGQLEVALFLPVLVTLYSAWYLRSTIRATVILVAASLSAPLVAWRLGADLLWAPWTAANVFTFTLGITLRRQRELIEQLQAAREALALRAVAEERRRIARELHDLAGHTIAAVLLHVTGARHVLRRDLGEAERALLDAESIGRSSLEQIRATVAALRTDEHGTDPALPGSADLDDLVDAYHRAGLRIAARIDATLTTGGALDGPTGTALHRIAQEALANVARHAPDNEVRVAVEAADREADGDREGDRCGVVRLTVTDRGRRPPPARSEELHFGLIGMRERARAVGGDPAAGPHDDGWRVTATLPLVAVPTPADRAPLEPS